MENVPERMKKRSDTGFFNRFMKKRIWILIFFVTLIFQVVIYFSFFQKSSLIFFPSMERNVEFYDDQFEGGNSVIENSVFSDSLINMKFRLKKGFVRPYVGMTLKDRKPIDVSGFNRIKISARGNGIKNIVVYVVTKNNNKKIDMDINYFCDNIELTNEIKEFNLRYSNFERPDWWNDINNLSPNLNLNPDWTQLLQVNLTNGLTPEPENSMEVWVYSVTFTRDNKLILVLMLFIQTGFLFILWALFYYSSYRNIKKLVPITINYVPVQINEKRGSKNLFLDYIHEQFTDSNLNLEKVSKNTNISQRAISDYISETFNCNFKTYINQIRINEAKRLLIETNMNMSEIAYKVGFSSPNNFNRVFKTFTGKSPSGFIQNNN